MRTGYPSKNPKIFMMMMMMMANGAKALVFALLFVLYNASELVAGDIVEDVSSRKLLTSEGNSEVNPEGRPSCNGRDISIFQAQVSPEGGIPAYLVQISNLCTGNCTKYDVHLNCGWFSSAKLINPKVFRRLRYNDCLVNGGRDLKPGYVVSFRYFNTFKYPMKLSSVKCK